MHIATSRRIAVLLGLITLTLALHAPAKDPAPRPNREDAKLMIERLEAIHALGPMNSRAQSSYDRHMLMLEALSGDTELDPARSEDSDYPVMFVQLQWLGGHKDKAKANALTAIKPFQEALQAADERRRPSIQRDMIPLWIVLEDQEAIRGYLDAAKDDRDRSRRTQRVATTMVRLTNYEDAKKLVNTLAESERGQTVGSLLQQLLRQRQFEFAGAWLNELTPEEQQKATRNLFGRIAQRSDLSFDELHGFAQPLSKDVRWQAATSFGSERLRAHKEPDADTWMKLLTLAGEENAEAMVRLENHSEGGNGFKEVIRLAVCQMLRDGEIEKVGEIIGWLPAGSNTRAAYTSAVLQMVKADDPDADGPWSAQALEGDHQLLAMRFLLEEGQTDRAIKQGNKLHEAIKAIQPAGQHQPRDGRNEVLAELAVLFHQAGAEAQAQAVVRSLQELHGYNSPWRAVQLHAEAARRQLVLDGKIDKAIAVEKALDQKAAELEADAKPGARDSTAIVAHKARALLANQIGVAAYQAKDPEASEAGYARCRALIVAFSANQRRAEHMARVTRMLAVRDRLAGGDLDGALAGIRDGTGPGVPQTNEVAGDLAIALFKAKRLDDATDMLRRWSGGHVGSINNQTDRLALAMCQAGEADAAMDLLLNDIKATHFPRRTMEYLQKRGETT